MKKFITLIFLSFLFDFILTQPSCGKYTLITKKCTCYDSSGGYTYCQPPKLFCSPSGPTCSTRICANQTIIDNYCGCDNLYICRPSQMCYNSQCISKCENSSATNSSCFCGESGENICQEGQYCDLRHNSCTTTLPNKEESNEAVVVKVGTILVIAVFVFGSLFFFCL